MTKTVRVVLTEDQVEWLRSLVMADKVEYGNHRDYDLEGAEDLIRLLEGHNGTG